jgi:hypothetical protein
MINQRYHGICKTIKGISLYVRHWCENQHNVKEESITDWLLYELKVRLPFITYVPFSRNTEGTVTGADWEWWILFSNFSYKFRVQAKMVKPNKDNYYSIAYTNLHGMQIEMLINDAIQNNSIPLYAFYTRIANKVQCGANITDEGVYLSDANRILENIIISGKKYTDVDDVLQYSIPLSCLLCCQMINWNDGNNPDYDGFLRRYFPTSVNSNLYIDDMPLGKYKEVPGYVESFLKYSIEGLPDRWEKEFAYNVKDLNGLIVYDLRDLHNEEGIDNFNSLN